MHGVSSSRKGASLSTSEASDRVREFQATAYRRQARLAVRKPSQLIPEGTVAGNALTLVVTDNGAGLPNDFDWQHQRSLGLQLVSDLARQLQGEMKVGPGPEARFEVTIVPNRNENAEPFPSSPPSPSSMSAQR